MSSTTTLRWVLFAGLFVAINALLPYGGLIVPMVALLTIILVWAPLGVFVWDGLPEEAITFQEGFRHLSAIMLVVYYAANGLILTQLRKADWKRVIGLSILGIWLLGLLGSLKAYFSILARFGAT